MSIEHNYEVRIDWVKDRVGELYSPELYEDLQVAPPPPFPKGLANIWSPEQLFTAAINSCLMTTFLSIAESSKLEFLSFSSKAIGKLEQVEKRYVMSEVTLMPLLTIAREEDREKAMKVLKKSEESCLISNSVISKIIFMPEVTVAASK